MFGCYLNSHFIIIDFSPFGKTIELNEDADGDGVKLTLNLRFPGQYYDAESGLHYNWHRYYDPETGRYVTPDKVQWRFAYNYVNSNPILFKDPLGLCQSMDDINNSIRAADRIFWHYNMGHLWTGGMQSIVGGAYWVLGFFWEHADKQIKYGYGCIDTADELASLFNSSGAVKSCCWVQVIRIFNVHQQVKLHCMAMDLCDETRVHVTKIYDPWVAKANGRQDLDT